MHTLPANFLSILSTHPVKHPPPIKNRFLGSSGKLLGANIVWILVIFGWTTAMMLPFFLILRACKLLRVSEEEEMQGVDVSKHGGSAYLIDDVPASMGKTSPTGSIEQQLAMLQDRVLVLEGAKATV